MKSSAAITLLLSLCVLVPNAARAQSAKLSLATIEGHYILEGPGATSDYKWREPEANFVVLIENTSSRDIGIYRQWNSWGYYSIHFVVKTPDGKQTVIEKEPRGWDRNFPESFGLPAGMTHAVSISFTSKEWNGIEALSAKGAQLKAVFQQKPLEEREKDIVWSSAEIFTNKIESAFVPWDILSGRKIN